MRLILFTLLLLCCNGNAQLLCKVKQVKGCFKDLQNKSRVFPVRALTVNLTQESCAESCWAMNYTYAGVEFGVECYCGNELAYTSSAPLDDCNMTCPANSEQKCGAVDRLYVYESECTAPTTWSSIARFSTAPAMSNCLLQGKFIIPTVAECLVANKQLGFGSGKIDVLHNLNERPAGCFLYLYQGVKHKIEFNENLETQLKAPEGYLQVCTMQRFISAEQTFEALGSMHTILLSGQTLSSSLVSLTLQTDGNLVLWTTGGKLLWASNTPGRCVEGGKGLQMQGDGNLVLRDCSSTVIWSSGTNGNSGAFLKFQLDCNLVLYSSDEKPLWASETNCDPPQGKVCSRTSDWCFHPGAMFSWKDSDGDGLLDPFCIDKTGTSGALLSGSSCRDNWPQTPTAATCPSGYTYTELDVADGAWNVNRDDLRSVQGCAQFCSENPGCTMFEFNLFLQRCKTSTGSVSSQNQTVGWTSCVKVPPSPPTAVPPAALTDIQGIAVGVGVVAIIFCLYLKFRKKRKDQAANRTEKLQAMEMGQAVNPKANVQDDPEMGHSAKLSIIDLGDLGDLDHGLVLGKGYFGIVQKVVYEGTDCALKKPKFTSAEAPEEFRREAELMTVLGQQGQHENLVTMKGFLENPIGIVMNIAGDNLEEAIIKKSRFSSGNESMLLLLELCIGISAGVQKMHKCRIIHRDLALRNVLLGSGNTALVCDFGLSFQEDSDPKQFSKMIPVRWSSPEAISGKTPEKASDIYMLGMTMYEMFSRQKPFQELGDDMKTIQEQVIKGKKPQIPEEWPSLLKDLIELCINSEPSKRPTAEQVNDDLRRMKEQAKEKNWGVPAFSRANVEGTRQYTQWGQGENIHYTECN
mmetsp:Transcript_39943/g.78539  ORF Transcript_39943/g.78539 Transcript_39943/m.78539 type:complete len:860 (-) Transcript_39943:42-2621(-)